MNKKNKMKVGVLFSGGKDSCLALHKSIKQGYKIDCLLSMIPEIKDSFMFHTPIIKLLEKQAEMLGIKMIIGKTKGEKEKELVDLKKLVEKSGVDVLIIGGIKSNYQLERIKKICSELKIKLIAPLLGYNEKQLWKELLDNKFKVIITKIASQGIPKEFIGRIINKKNFAELEKLSAKYKFRLDFEGGDAETSVLYMPEFKKQIELEYDIESEDEYRHFLKLKKIW